MALHIAFQQTGKTGIYTTPLKALSNQKYSELAAIFGRASTGLSTGDISINKGARITIMTTEVYRNIAWRSSTPSSTLIMGNKNYNELEENAVVVLDEFHYMGNPGRGGVWEESVITSPEHTQIIGLSATLSNAPALAAWMESVTGRRTILVEVPASKRPVPLRYLFATKEGLYPLFRDPDAGPGAPKGLLGYRGDGETLNQSQAKKRKGGGGFGNGDDEEDADTDQKLPRGLQVNPALRDAAAKRFQRVDRAIERQKVRRRLGSDFDDEWNEPSPRQQVYQSAKKLNAKEERKERERLLKKEMRRAVPSMHALMTRLDQKELLPAIFFIFSRAGCDEAARLVYRYMKGPRDPDLMLPEELEKFSGSSPKGDQKTRKSRLQENRRKGIIRDSNGRAFRPGSNFVSDELILSSLYEAPGQLLNEADFDDSASPLAAENWEYYSEVGLLKYKEVREVASRISIFNKDNVEIAFDDDLIEQYLFGVGSHHAGMLPAHKSFVEVLFRNQLMKVVFATETLAAGINMPARTTVICSMAKKGNGGSSMNLLDTSNLLQMAGRAGRRGMDTDGTCVIVATPFESHDDAAKILTDPILPIASQFSPSYSLCVNLIARGEGGLSVAKQLVSKSFAMWERRQAEEYIEGLVDTHGEGVREALQASAHDKFINVLVDTLQSLVNQRTAKFDVARIEALLEILSDQKILKKSSKSYVGAAKMLELETATLGYLEKELAAAREKSVSEDMDRLLYEYEPDLLNQIDIQQKRAINTEREVSKHPFTAIATIATSILSDSTPEASRLARALGVARGEEAQDLSASSLSPEELSAYAKSAVVLRRKTRKLAKAIPGFDNESLREEETNAEDAADDSWDDFLSITRTLVAYGCLSTKSPLKKDLILEEETFELTPAGLNLGMLGFENSLWALVAMGGAWDVTGASSKLDEFRDAMKSFDEDDGELYDVEPTPEVDVFPTMASKPQEEADGLVSLLKRMSPSELAGYVSSLISEDSRGGGPSVVELFQRVTPLQQQVVQKSLFCLERLVEVQKQNMVDEATRTCNL